MNTTALIAHPASDGSGITVKPARRGTVVWLAALTPFTSAADVLALLRSSGFTVAGPWKRSVGREGSRVQARVVEDADR